MGQALAAQNAYTFIGINDQKKEGKYTFPMGIKYDPASKVAQPYKWGKHEPNNLNTENCVHIRKAQGDLNDISCNNKYKALCQKNCICLLICKTIFNFILSDFK